MPKTTEDGVWAALSTVQDPEILLPITDLGMVRSVAVDEAGHADVSILLTIAGCPPHGVSRPTCARLHSAAPASSRRRSR